MQFGHAPQSSGPLTRKLAAQYTPVDNPVLPSIIAVRSIIDGKRAQRAAENLVRRNDERERLKSLQRLPWQDVELAQIYRAEVAAKHGLTIRELDCNLRRRWMYLARHEAMYLVVRDTGLSYPRIGKMFGGRDHSSIINAVSKHAERNGLPLPRGMVARG